MDQGQLRERYHDEDFGASAGWPMGAEGYQSPHIISPGQEYHDFSFNNGPVQMPQMYANPTPPMPQHTFAPTWPSLLASPQHSVAGQMVSAPPMTPMQPYVPPQPLPPLVTTAPAHSAPPQSSSSRRTLTDQDRRRMCQYHEENPTVKQTEIGAMFGVERSTVSKVLRQKEKYLAADEGSKSPIRRSKGNKFPDIERALTNWAAKHQQKGIQLTDDQIREKARFFAASVGNPEASLKVSSPSWLEKFKQKNQIGGGKHKKGSILSGEGRQSQRQDSQAPSGISPVSPGGGLDTSPMTPGGERTFDARTGSPASSTSRLLHSKSAASLASSTFSDPPSAFSTTAAPPMPVSFAQQIKATQAGVDMSRMMASVSSDSHRPRSQTFPMLGIEASHLAFTDAQMEEMMATSALETPGEEYPGRSLSVASLSSSEMPHVSHSQASTIETPGLEQSPIVMGPPIGGMHPGSATPGNVASSMGRPTLDEGRRGLEVAMGFITTLPSGVVDPQDYMLLGKLMQKLNGLGSLNGEEMPGGMHPIDVKKEMSRKRSIQSL